MSKKIGTFIKSFRGERIGINGEKIDVILIWYRDENGVKQVKCYDRPTVDYYIIKDKNSHEAAFPPLYIQNDKVEKFTTYSDNLYRELALKTKAVPFYDKIKMSKGPDSFEMKNLHRHPWVYSSDMDIEDRYIAKFHEEYEPDINYQLHKCMFDIEVDLAPNGLTPDRFGHIGYVGFPTEEDAPCPINIITLIDGRDLKIYSYVVRNQKNSSLIDFEASVDRHKAELLEKIKTEDKTEMVSAEVEFFDAEEDAIKAFFDKTHEINPDYMLAWNECFDVITMMNRLKKLYYRKTVAGLTNYDMTLNTVCDLRYSQIDGVYIKPKAYYKANKKELPGTRIDYFSVLDGIVWVDSEYYYALNHNAGGKKDSYKLNDIAWEELKKAKLPFYPGQTIKNLPWIKFEQFYEYNVRDVLLLLLLENKNLDFDNLQRLSEITNTRKDKVFSKSISVTNFVNKFATSAGWIMNSNKNQVYNKETTAMFDVIFNNLKTVTESNENYVKMFSKKDKYGALVCDPNLNENVGEEIIEGYKSKYLYRYVCDEDASSMYPSTIRCWNLDASTELGKFFLRDDMLKQRLKDKYGYDGLFKLSEKDEDAANEEVAEDNEEETKDKNVEPETDDLGPTFVDEFMSQDWNAIGEKFFLLPSIEEMYEEILKTNFLKELEQKN